MHFKCSRIALLSPLLASQAIAHTIPTPLFAGLLCVAQDGRYLQSELFKSRRSEVENDLSRWPAGSLVCLRKTKPLSFRLCKDVTALSVGENLDEAAWRAVEKKHAAELKKIDSNDFPCFE